MAKVFEIMELLEDGIKFAQTEDEKRDLTNHFADFCDDVGGHFSSKAYYDFEKSVVNAIEYGNDPEYTFKRFEKYFAKEAKAFAAMKNEYCSMFETQKPISFAICAHHKHDLYKCLESIFTYHRKDIEVVVLDCSQSHDLEDTVRSFKPHNVHYHKSGYKLRTEQELEAVSLCSGMFIFPVNEDDEISPEILPDLTLLIKNNPQIGAILCPHWEGSRYTFPENLWETVEPDHERLQLAKVINYKTGFGFKRELLDFEAISKDLKQFETPEHLCNEISHMVCEHHEAALVSVAIYRDKVK